MTDRGELMQRLFEYDYWGNCEALASLNSLADGKERALQVFGHIIGAQQIWMARFENPAPPVAVWPTMTVEECRAAVERLRERWTGLLAGWPPEKLQEDLTYRNTKGAEFKTPVADVLMHVIMHSAYHRGQVALAVRQAGGKPAATDYVVYLRQVKKP